MRIATHMLYTMAGLCLAWMSTATAAPLFMEDFKTGGNLGAGVMHQGSGSYTVTTGTELLEIAGTGHDAGGVWANYGILYPASGTITWDTTQNRYIQAWIPYNSDSDQPNLFVQIDGGGWTNTWYDIGILGGDTATNHRPGILNLNALTGMSAGVHQLRFRLNLGNTPYSWHPVDTNTSAMAMDWFKGGMAPTANTNVGACTFVGPADGASTNNPPTLQWNAPAGFTGGTYSVSYSQDAHFRGPTTVTQHGINSTSYTPPAALNGGTWYWTVMAVNSDDVTGLCLPKGLADLIGGSNPDWNAPYDTEFYSFQVNTVPVELSNFVVE